MVLIVTERGDLTADFLVVELEARGADFLRLNTEDYPMAIKLAWRPDGARMTVGGRVVDTSEIDSVWYRRPVPPAMPDDYSSEQARWASAESSEALHGVWNTLDARWVNRPDANRRAESKPDQLRRASTLGFDIPPTLVTNDAAALGRFIDSQSAVICKPLLDGLVPEDESERLFFTSRVDPKALHAGDLGPEPYLFQALVEKTLDIRVTVIGDEIFAVGIESQGEPDSALDWRRGAHLGLRHSPMTLPEPLARQCLALCRHYGLLFGAIDLAARPDGGYTFFEINPNGQWAWLEQETGLPLRSTLAELLVRGLDDER
jgi:glutathione synthase/RimK-type ligase-like ATP-grasp enzyme